MQQRAISEGDVEYCLAHYDVKCIPANGNRIKVVVKAGSQDRMIVITTASLVS